MNIDQVVEAMVALSTKKTHPDKVACLFSVCMAVTLKITKKMEEMRRGDKRSNC